MDESKEKQGSTSSAGKPLEAPGNEPQSEANQSGDDSVTQRAEMYEGMLPHPDLLRGFDDVLPGSAERIVAMGEQQMDHRHRFENRGQEYRYELEKKDLENDIEETRELSKTTRRTLYALLGLIGWISTIGFSVFAFLVYNGKDLQAFAAFIASALGLLGGVLSVYRGMRKQAKAIEATEQRRQARQEADEDEENDSETSGDSA